MLTNIFLLNLVTLNAISTKQHGSVASLFERPVEGKKNGCYGSDQRSTTAQYPVSDSKLKVKLRKKDKTGGYNTVFLLPSF